jgi:hypothetical protein
MKMSRLAFVFRLKGSHRGPATLLSRVLLVLPEQLPLPLCTRQHTNSGITWTVGLLVLSSPRNVVYWAQDVSLLYYRFTQDQQEFMFIGLNSLV